MILTKKFFQRTFLIKWGQLYSNHYDILGIDQGASQQEIKTKYF
jgi:DnaJ-class molecular chaperone